MGVKSVRIKDILHFCPAYRLKKCPAPPVVENAELFYEDKDFQIGNVPLDDIQYKSDLDLLFSGFVGTALSYYYQLFFAEWASQHEICAEKNLHFREPDNICHVFPSCVCDDDLQ